MCARFCRREPSPENIVDRPMFLNGPAPTKPPSPVKALELFSDAHGSPSRPTSKLFRLVRPAWCRFGKLLLAVMTTTECRRSAVAGWFNNTLPSSSLGTSRAVRFAVPLMPGAVQSPPPFLRRRKVVLFHGATGGTVVWRCWFCWGCHGPGRLEDYVGKRDDGRLDPWCCRDNHRAAERERDVLSP